MTTRAALFDLNCRRFFYTQTRRKLLHEVLTRHPRSLITLQECPDNMRADILSDLGSDWAGTNHHKVATLWDKTKWKLLHREAYNMPSPATFSPRRFLLVTLQRIDTGDELWLGNTHLTVHQPSEASWRKKQATFIAEIFASDVFSGAAIAMAGDFNEYGDSVRGILRNEAGLKDLRRKAPPLTREQYDTHHNMDSVYSLSERTGSDWLDDILTSEKITVYGGAVLLTYKATDHNALLGRLEFGGKVLP
jgi:endonuclease/exonuclease/phosphatase family metal-dependent hydrolase